MTTNQKPQQQPDLATVQAALDEANALVASLRTRTVTLNVSLREALTRADGAEEHVKQLTARVDALEAAAAEVPEKVHVDGPPAS